MRKEIYDICVKCVTEVMEIPIEHLWKKNFEYCVDARVLLVHWLTENNFSERRICGFSGQSQQRINRLKNISSDRMLRAYYRKCYENLSNKMNTIILQENDKNKPS